MVVCYAITVRTTDVIRKESAKERKISAFGGLSCAYFTIVINVNSTVANRHLSISERDLCTVENRRIDEITLYENSFTLYCDGEIEKDYAQHDKRSTT